jgi:AraC family transcriptional regulator
MENLRTGQFFGQTNKTIRLKGITLTDTEYTHENVDWHYHENAYFTFILQGKVLEGNRKEIFRCAAGSLLFHNWQEAHYNIKPKGFTRGFHLELEREWFSSMNEDYGSIEGSMNLRHPDLKLLMYLIFRESKLEDSISPLAIETLLTELLSQMASTAAQSSRLPPRWVAQLQELLHDAPASSWTLNSLSQTLGIHPSHLSRGFRRYFGCTLGAYIRKLRLQQALAMLPEKGQSLTDIALACGFADQSHFIRSFKAATQTTPSQFRSCLRFTAEC